MTIEDKLALLPNDCMIILQPRMFGDKWEAIMGFTTSRNPVSSTAATADQALTGLLEAQVPELSERIVRVGNGFKVLMEDLKTPYSNFPTLTEAQAALTYLLREAEIENAIEVELAPVIGKLCYQYNLRPHEITRKIRESI